MGRLVRTIAITLLGVGLTVTIGLWLFLWSWLPTQGKALLIERLEASGTMEASITSMRYELLRGLTVEELQLVDRATKQLWCSLPVIRMRFDWLAVLRGRIGFRGQAPIDVPVRTDVTLAGQYHPFARSFSVAVETAEIRVRSVTQPLKRWVPPALTDGTFQLDIELTQRPDTVLSMSGQLTGHQLVWQADPVRVTGDVIVSGIATPPIQKGFPWSFDLVANIQDGQAEHVPTVGNVTQVQGTIRATPQQIIVEQLHATLLGSPWVTQGRIALTHPPSYELLATSTLTLQTVAVTWPTMVRDWKPTGQAVVQVDCHGLFAPGIPADCQMQTQLKDGVLAGPALPDPITGITGSVHYDLLSQTLDIEQLQGQVSTHTVQANGTIVLAEPAHATLTVNGTVPLSYAARWLPKDSGVSHIDGTATLQVNAQGPLAHPMLTGEIVLREVQAQLAAPKTALTQGQGRAVLAGQRIELREAMVRLNDQPFRLSGVLNLDEEPSMTATIGFSNGELWVSARQANEAWLIDDSRLSVGQNSQLRLQGRIGRRGTPSSSLAFSGTVDVAELKQLPGGSLAQIDSLGLHGVLTVDGQFQGQLTDWPQASVRAQVRADRVQIREIPLNQVVCQIDQGPRGLVIEIPSALLADGHLTGKVTLEHRGPQQDYFLAEADVTAVQLGQLSTAIPAWRTHSPSGTASAHAVVSGIASQRSSWRGEGWLNAAGEELGDVPLLEKYMAILVFVPLADRVALDSLRRAQVKQVALTWRLAQERVSSDDLRIGAVAGGAPVAVYAKGNIGLDQTLDVLVEPELSDALAAESPILSDAARKVLQNAERFNRIRRLFVRYRLRGTLKDPKKSYEIASMDELLGSLIGDLFRGLLNQN